MADDNEIHDTDRDSPISTVIFKRDSHGRFDIGGTAGPGRPIGARNYVTRLLAKRFAEHADQIVTKAIDSALAEKGGGADRRQILKLLYAESKEREMEPFALPPLKEPADSVVAMEAIGEAIRAGELTQTEAIGLTKVVEAFVGAINATKLDQEHRALKREIKALKGLK
jgi:hypothetical protein